MPYSALNLLYTSSISLSSSERFQHLLVNAIDDFTKESSDHNGMVKVSFKIHKTNGAAIKISVCFRTPR
jgi:hypothetical protein